MAEIKVRCPHCKQHAQCDESYRGMQINCPSCKKVIRIPAASANQKGNFFNGNKGSKHKNFGWISPLIGVALAACWIIYQNRSSITAELSKIPAIPSILDQKVHVSGRVYVITKGEQVIPMPNVDIMAFNEDSLRQAATEANHIFQEGTKKFGKAESDLKASQDARRKQIETELQALKAEKEQCEQRIEQGEQKIRELATAFEVASNECNVVYEEYKQEKQWAQDGDGHSTPDGWRVSTTADVSKAYNKFVNSARVYKAIEANYQKAQQQAFEGTNSKQQLETLSKKETDLDDKMQTLNGLQKLAQSQDNKNIIQAVADNLPSPAKKATTDGNGYFTVVLEKAGNYVFLGEGQREVADETERYFWVYRTAFNTAGEYKIEIKNDNDMRSRKVASALNMLGTGYSENDVKYMAQGESMDYWLEFLSSYGLDTSLYSANQKE